MAAFVVVIADGPVFAALFAYLVMRVRQHQDSVALRRFWDTGQRADLAGEPDAAIAGPRQGGAGFSP